MIEIALDQITRENLEALVVNQTHEGKSLDYKRDLNLSTDEHKRELARDVSSFANAGGGDLVFGVEEAKDADGKNLGYPARIVGVACSNFDLTKQRFESIVRDNIEPRVQGLQITKVDGFDQGPVTIVRVPRSWIGPHMVSYAKQTHFYSRNSAGRQPLDVREIRSAFLSSAELTDRVRRFRDERLGRVVAGETPVALMKDRAKLVVHAIPLGDDVRFDFARLEKESALIRPLSDAGGWNNRYNLDGYLAFSGPNHGEQRCYSQAFRHGAIEGVAVLTIGDGHPPTLYAKPIEADVVTAAASYVKLIRDSGGLSPVSLQVAVLGVRGTRIRHGDYEPRWDRDIAIDRDNLLLPDVVVDRGQTDDLAETLRPTFDALWQASGWDRSYGYNAEGKWDVRAHR